jgi:hypothetical protein
MPAVRSGRRASREDEQFGLLEIARARGMESQEDTALPPGRRDASGFWFPAAYSDPMGLFTPHQRTLQAKQRVLKSRRSHTAPPPQAPPPDSATRARLLADAAPAPSCSLSGPAPRSREADARAQREPGAACVDSPRRSV